MPKVQISDPRIEAIREKYGLDPSDFWERFEEKFIPEPMSGCWLWEAAARNGYGVFKIKGRYRPAHQVSYMMHGSGIPSGMVLDHLCRNTYCVNPAHLEPVSIGENVRRGNNHYRDRSHCKNGHEFTEETTRISKTGARICRACQRNRLEKFHGARTAH